jgi:HEAT repeat protein
LGRIGAPAAEAGIALAEALGDEAYRVRAAAAKALGQIGCLDNEVISVLMDAQYDKIPPVRQAAREAVRVLNRARIKTLSWRSRLRLWWWEYRFARSRSV